jgi:hypothetical protein
VVMTTFSSVQSDTSASQKFRKRIAVERPQRGTVGYDQEVSRGTHKFLISIHENRRFTASY